MEANMYDVVGPIAHEVQNGAQHRDIVVVVTNDKRQAFYRSTGINSGRPGVWFPFDGICVLPRLGLWFVKQRFVLPEQMHTPLYRFGTDDLLAVSTWLGSQNIPLCNDVRPSMEVNRFIDNEFTAECNQTFAWLLAPKLLACSAFPDHLLGPMACPCSLQNPAAPSGDTGQPPPARNTP